MLNSLSIKSSASFSGIGRRILNHNHEQNRALVMAKNGDSAEAFFLFANKVKCWNGMEWYIINTQRASASGLQ